MLDFVECIWSTENFGCLLLLVDNSGADEYGLCQFIFKLITPATSSLIRNQYFDSIQPS